MLDVKVDRENDRWFAHVLVDAAIAGGGELSWLEGDIDY